MEEWGSVGGRTELSSFGAIRCAYRGSLSAALAGEWTCELARQSGGRVSVRTIAQARKNVLIIRMNNKQVHNFRRRR